MKITAAKRSRSDIIRDRDEYDSRRNTLHEEYDSQFRQYRDAVHSLTDSIQARVIQIVGEWPRLNLEITATQAYSYGIHGIEVNVSSNQHNLHDESKALSWNWSVIFDRETGDVKKSSGSWSGLQAISPDQMKSLRDSVTVLERLNDIDWASMLDVQVPEISNYVKVSTYSVDHDRPDFEQELLEVEIEDLIGADVLIKAVPGTSKFYRGNYYLGLIADSPSMIEVFEVPGSSVTVALESGDPNALRELVTRYEGNSYKMRKSSLYKNVVVDKHSENMLDVITV